MQMLDELIRHEEEIRKPSGLFAETSEINGGHEFRDQGPGVDAQ